LSVFVLDQRKRPVRPCCEKRARLLLERGRAVVDRSYPLTIRLKDRARGDVEPVQSAKWLRLAARSAAAAQTFATARSSIKASRRTAPVFLAAPAWAPRRFAACEAATWCEPRCQQASRSGPTVDVPRLVAAALSEWAMPAESTPSPCKLLHRADGHRYARYARQPRFLPVLKNGV
jgi:hypothetical protein